MKKDTVISIRCSKEDRDIFYHNLFMLKSKMTGDDSTNNIKIINKALTHYNKKSEV